MIFTVNGQKLETLTYYSLIQLAGFIILLLGVFVYNEIIVLRCCGLATNTKREKERLKIENLTSGHFSEITYKSYQYT